MDFRFKTLAAEVDRRLGFLVSDHGFVGPAVTRSEHGIPEMTNADRCTESGTDTAHKGHQMRKALDKQSGALRALLRKPDQHR